jgi:uncharacterized protein YciI
VPGRGPREQPLWDEHAAFMNELEGRGVLLLAGPFTDWTGALLVLEAADADEARRLLDPDPWVADRDILRVGEIRPWEAWIGEPPGRRT